MSDANFRARWESLLLKKSIPESLTLVRAPSVAALERISAAARTFLTETGLPKSAAPCLIFEEVGKGLPKLWEVYSPQPEWKPEEKKAVEPYLMMGSDGAGSPICANERDETIVLLDHELLFTPRQLLKRVMFMNTSVSQLAECLLEYNANLNSPSLDKVREIDPPAAAPNTFWFNEINAVAAQSKPWWKIW